jgi:spore germination protein YaaH
VVDSAGVHGIDPENKVRRVIESTKEDTEVLPMVNDYNTLAGKWDGATIGQVLNSPAASASLQQQIDAFLSASPSYRGITLDFEEIPDDAQDAYLAFIARLYSDLHAKNLFARWATMATIGPSRCLRMEGNSRKNQRSSMSRTSRYRRHGSAPRTLKRMPTLKAMNSTLTLRTTTRILISDTKSGFSTA